MVRTSTVPFRFQRKGIRKIAHFVQQSKRGGALLADEMGLGKTFQALRYADEYEAFPALVVCPGYLKLNWEREALHHIGVRPDVLSGRRPPKGHAIKRKLAIINYDILKGWSRTIRAWAPKLIIWDECQFLQNRSSIRYKLAKRLSRRAQQNVCLSGTPFTNCPAELWTILNLLRPDLYDSFLSYAMEYCEPERKPWGWEYKGARNLPKLHKELNSTMLIRRLKADVLDQLPPKIRTLVPIELTGRREYDEAVRDFMGWLCKQSRAKAKRAKKAERLVKMGYLKRLVAKLKLPKIIEWVDNFLATTDQKLVLFGIHKEILHVLRERYKRLAVYVDGTVTNLKRQRAVDKFQKNKACRLFIGNMKAAGTGLTLTAASHLAFVEMGWTPAEHRQAEDRIHRIGQFMPANIYYLLGDRTIEARLCELLIAKQDTQDAVLDGRKVESFDVFNAVLESMGVAA